jgi:hypothetical protein
MPVFNLLNFSKISHDNQETKCSLRNVSMYCHFLLLKTVMLLLASCKYVSQRFLVTVNGNHSATGMTDTVQPFPRTILQKVSSSIN